MGKTEIKGILFDMGGTLIDYTPPDSFLISCRAYARRNGVPLSDGLFDKIEEKSKVARKKSSMSNEEFNLWKIFHKILDRHVGIGFDWLMGRFYRYYAMNCNGAEVYRDALPVLRKLKKKGLRMGLVSNTCFPSKMHLWDLKRFGLMPFFDYTLFSVDYGLRKPHPEIYSEALRRLKVRSREALFIGDRLDKDVLGPQASGMQGVLVDRSRYHIHEYVREEHLGRTITIVGSLKLLTQIV